MVEVGTGSSGSRFLNKNWPIEEGLTAGTTRQTGNPTLEPENGSILRAEDKIGIE
jgi:hypothetical protein